MAPFFNMETGELSEANAGEVTEPLTPEPAAGEPKPAEPSETPDALTSPQPGSPAAAAIEVERIRSMSLADPSHPLRDPSHPLHEAAVEDYLRLTMLAEGKDADNPEHNPELGELHEGGRIRPRDAAAEAAALAALPALPPGTAWDPHTHQALAALAADTPGVATAVEAGYSVVARAQEIASRGLAPDELSWERTLVERWGPNHDDRVEHAAYALELLASDDEPAIQRAAEWLGTLWEWDARIVVFLAEQVYPVLRDGTPGPLVTEMLLRNGTRWAQGQAAGRARATKKTGETPPDTIVSSGGRP